MKLKQRLQKWLGIKNYDTDIVLIRDELSAIKKELYVNYGTIPDVHGVLAHVLAIMQYLDVVPYIELKKDPGYLDPEPPRNSIRRVNKRSKIKSQVVIKD